jgi:hypothetical protein
MSKQDEPDDSASSEEEAELRALRRVASALERGDIDELAARALGGPRSSVACAAEP